MSKECCHWLVVSSKSELINRYGPSAVVKQGLSLLLTSRNAGLDPVNSMIPCPNMIPTAAKSLA
jgi:hypothetical protein